MIINTYTVNDKYFKPSRNEKRKTLHNTQSLHHFNIFFCVDDSSFRSNRYNYHKSFNFFLKPPMKLPRMS